MVYHLVYAHHTCQGMVEKPEEKEVNALIFSNPRPVTPFGKALDCYTQLSNALELLFS